jgi:tetratricopeptide (TPR) repeat protein
MESRSGELAMRPLPAVLLDLHEELATGKLLLRRGKMSKTIDLVNGNPVSSASTPRDETLGHFLVTTGVITEDQHRAAVARGATLGGKLGEALVAMQLMSVEQLVEQLGKQARHKIVHALRWPQGAWRFDTAAQAAEGIQLRMIDVVVGGLRETAVDDLARLARLEGMTFELTPRGNGLRTELRKTFGEKVMNALGSGATMAEIEKAVGERAPARTAIDAMLMCDAVVAKAPSLRAGTVMGMGPGRSPDDNGDTLNDETLYETLFEDEPTVLPEPSAPLDFEFDDNPESGVVSKSELEAASALGNRAAQQNKAIAAEHQRIVGADHYAVLLIDRDAAAGDIDAAYQVKLAMFDRTSRGDHTPTDRTKIDAIRAAYAAARDALIDPRKRTAYDRELAGGELVEGPPTLDTELMFRSAEDHMAKGQWAQAIGILKTSIHRSPNEADYHAALGWAMWNAGDRSGAAADAARGALNLALSINPDHPAAHDYKGRVDAAQRTDDAAALFHLERALDLDPHRRETLQTIEDLLIARGELRRLERVLKRVLFRLRGSGGSSEAHTWVRLARLYLEHLDYAQGGQAAVANAKKLAPKDPEVIAIAQRAEQIYQTSEEPLVRAGWREALADPHSGAALVRSTEAAGHVDAAFLAASTMVALNTADDAMRALFEQHRPRAAKLPTTPLTRDQWALLRHKDDSVELGALIELLAPAIHKLAPMTLADGELDASQRVGDSELPRAFGWLRAQLGAVLGVADAPVYARPELGAQLHVVAADPPVLVAGDEVLTAPERPDLVFRLARALTFLWPGRAVGASRPGRILKAVVLAIVREASGTDLGIDDPLAPRAMEALAVVAPGARVQARASALRLLSKGGGGLNLSVWARSLTRTANRAGMVLCGDVPSAVAGAKEMGDLDKDLVEFAFSAAHVSLRRQLGLVT